MTGDITSRRTGRLYSFSSVEFEVTFPDGSSSLVWSPPWSDLDYDDPKQDEGAVEYARKLWAEKVNAIARASGDAKEAKE